MSRVIFCPRLIRAGFFALVLVFLPSAGSSAAENAYASWFKLGDEAYQDWTVSEVPETAAMQIVIRRREEDRETPVRRVFVLYPRPSSAYDIAMTKILELFADKNINAEITVVNFNKTNALGQKALELARRNGSELIFSMGSESTAWLHKNFLGGPIPVVSVCSKDPVELGQVHDYVSGSGNNFAFTSLNMPVDAQMSYVLELKPNLKNIAILVDARNISAVQTQAEPMAEYAKRHGILAINVTVQDPAKAREEIAKLIPQAVSAMRKNDPDLQNSVFWITGSTSVFREIATINANADRVPVLSVVPEVVGPGDDSAVISIGISFQSNAHLAAIYGADILAGRVDVGALKVGVVSPPDIAINFRRARAIGVHVPFSFFESASFIYDYEGRLVRNFGKSVARQR